MFKMATMYRKLLVPFMISLIAGVTFAQEAESLEGSNIIEINATEVFIQKMRDVFQLPPGGSKHSFYASVYGYPDLHDWIKYAYDDRLGEGYLYGMTPLVGRTRLQLSSLELSTYNTRVMDVTLRSVHKHGHARRQVELELYNVDIQDMFVGYRLENLRNVLKNNLWRTAHDLYFTFLAPANRPNRLPREKEGVRVRLGSRAKFTTDLLVLQKEVQPLYERRPCPVLYKKTTAERFFRAENFGVDWCNFRLINVEPGKIPISIPPSPHGKLPEAWDPEDGYDGGSPETASDGSSSDHPGHIYVKREEIPQRDYLWDALLTVVIPLISMVTLIILLTFIMCIDVDKCRKAPIKDNGELEMMQYKSVQQASLMLRTMSRNRDSVTPTTRRRSPKHQQVSVRSRSESPEATQPKMATMPRWSEERTMAGSEIQAPPPYHPVEINGKAVQGYHV